MQMLKKIMYSITESIDKDIKQQEIASAINKSESRISKFFNEDKDLYFCDMLLAIKKYALDKEDELVNQCIDYYLHDFNVQPFNVKCILDYLYNKRNVTGIQNVLNRIKGNGNREVKDWYNLYKIAIRYLIANSKDDFKKVNLDLESYSPKYEETKIFKELLLTYVSYQLRYYNQLFERATNLQEKIDLLKDGYMKESLKVKLADVLDYAYLHFKGDTEKAREYAKIVQESQYVCATFKYNTYYVMGTSYFFEDYNKAIENLTTYVSLLNKYNFTERAHLISEDDIAFVHAFWNNDRSMVRTDDVLVQGYFEAKHGDKERAVELVSNEPDSPFKNCILGIAKRDISYLYEAIIEFNERGDKHMAKLPRIELEIIKKEKGEG